MKKAYQYIALAVLTIGLAACTQEDDFTPQGNQKDAPLAIASAGVTELTTRATINNDYLEGGSIGVFVTSTTNNVRYSGNNIKWTYGNDGWKLDDATVVLYENNGEKQQIAAYYPYNENLGTGNVYSISLPEAYSEDYEDFDYLYGQYDPLSSNPAIIRLNHLMAKVTVNIQATGTEIGGDNVKSISLMNVPRSASWTVPTNDLGDLGTANQVIALYANDTNNDQTVDNYVGYALPDAATSLGIRVTMSSGRSFVAQAPIAGGLASGSHYLISMKLGKDAVTVGNITIGDWGTPESNPTGSETTEIFINSTVSGETAAIDIVSGATEGVQTAISNLLADNAEVTTLTVNGAPTVAQQDALAAALANFDGTLIMDVTDATDAIKNLGCTKKLGGYTVAADGTTTTYTVYTEAGLNAWREAVEENMATNLTLGADIILSTDGIEVTNDKPSGSNWTYVMRFSGTLDGGGHRIVNLRMYDEEYAHFIWVVDGGTIKNLTFVNPVIYCKDRYTATLASQIVGCSSIIGCHVQGGSVTGYIGTGGLIATISDDTNYIYGCTNSAKVTGTQWVGGIVGSGSNTDNVFAACANTGEVSGNDFVGGIVGHSKTSEELIACYTTKGKICGNTSATVTGSYYVASGETDEEGGTTAVADAAALNSTEVVNAMNAAIDTYNSSATIKVDYQWKVGTTLPVLISE